MSHIRNNGRGRVGGKERERERRKRRGREGKGNTKTETSAFPIQVSILIATSINDVCLLKVCYVGASCRSTEEQNITLCPFPSLAGTNQQRDSL